MLIGLAAHQHIFAVGQRAASDTPKSARSEVVRYDKADGGFPVVSDHVGAARSRGVHVKLTRRGG